MSLITVSMCLTPPLYFMFWALFERIFVYPTKLPLLVFRTVFFAPNRSGHLHLSILTWHSIWSNKCTSLTILSDVVGTLYNRFSHTQHVNLIGLSCSASDMTEAFSCVTYYTTYWWFECLWIFPKLLLTQNQVLNRNCPVLLVMVFLTTSF